VAVEQGRVPGGGDHGASERTAAKERRAAAAAGGGATVDRDRAAVSTLRHGADADVARGPGGAAHAVQRVRYKTGRLLPEYRPLNSPSFRPELHSNRHSHVVEKRYGLGKSAKDCGGDEERKGGGDLARLLDKDAVAFSGARPRTKGLRLPRRALAWSPPPPWRTPVSIGSAPALRVWRTTAAQRLAASVAAPIGGGAPRGEVGLGACTGELVKQPPLDGDRLLAPAIEVGQRRRCGTDGTRQAPAAPVRWNCGVEQTPPPPAAKPATGQHQTQRCRPSGTKNSPRAPEAKPAAAAGPLLCEPRETKKTPRAPAATAATGQLLCEPNVTKNTSEVPAAKTKTATAVRQLLCDHREAKKTRWAPSAKPPAGQCRCRHCGTEETPQWRQGPDGPCTLCNACGVRYRAGRLVPDYRLLNSPSFSPELHSNIRRHKESARGLPGRQRRQVMKKVINNRMIRRFSLFFLSDDWTTLEVKAFWPFHGF
jgi:hypothetical protein